jgi:hypothetical protein
VEAPACTVDVQHVYRVLVTDAMFPNPTRPAGHNRSAKQQQQTDIFHSEPRRGSDSCTAKLTCTVDHVWAGAPASKYRPVRVGEHINCLPWVEMSRPYWQAGSCIRSSQAGAYRIAKPGVPADSGRSHCAGKSTDLCLKGGRLAHNKQGPAELAPGGRNRNGGVVLTRRST